MIFTEETVAATTSVQHPRPAILQNSSPSSPKMLPRLTFRISPSFSTRQPVRSARYLSLCMCSCGRCSACSRCVELLACAQPSATPLCIGAPTFCSCPCAVFSLCFGHPAQSVWKFQWQYLPVQLETGYLAQFTSRQFHLESDAKIRLPQHFILGGRLRDADGRDQRTSK